LDADLSIAIRLVIEHGGSVSLLQRKMKLGYFAASRLMDQMEKLGVVGPSKIGGAMRDVLIKDLSALAGKI